MKKLNSLAILAIAAIGLFACSKAEVPTPADTDSPETPAVVSTHTVTFEVGNPETKTAIVEHGSDPATYVWSASDADGIVIWENANIGTGVSMDFGSPADYSSATIRATFTDDESGSYVYKGFFSKGRSGGGEPLLYTTQTPTESSFDPNADILISKVTDAFNAPQSSVALKFKRVVIPNKMTLKGLTPGETISTVVVKGDKPLAGFYKYIGASVETPEGWYGSDNTITLNINREVPVSGELVVWFLARPVDDVTLTVTANGSSTIYSKTFGSTISFELGSYTVFGVSSLTRTPNYSGDYVLVNAAGTKMMGLYASGTNISAVDVTKSGDEILYDSDLITIANHKVTVVRGESGYTIKDASGRYLRATGSGSGKNELKAYDFGSDPLSNNAYWTISSDGADWEIEANNGENSRFIQYYAGSDYFACYNANTAARKVVLHVFSKVADNPAPRIGLAADAINISADEASSVDLGVTFGSKVTGVTVSVWGNEDCDEALEGGWLTAVYDGEARIVKYTVTSNTGAARSAYVKIVAENSVGTEVVGKVIVNQAKSGATELLFSSMSSTGYTLTRNVTIEDKTWEVYGFSNNGGKWTDIRAGRKDNTSSPYIATTFAFANAIQTISVTYNSTNSELITSAKIIMASDSDFTENKTEQDIVVESNTTKNYTVVSPAASRYYKIAFELAADSGNGGIVQIQQVVYSE